MERDIVFKFGKNTFEMEEFYTKLDKDEVLKLMALNIEQNIPFDYDDKTFMVWDLKEIQIINLKRLFPYLFNINFIFEFIKRETTLSPNLNHNQMIDVKGKLEEVSKVCSKYKLFINHAYEGFSGNSFELAINEKGA